MSGSNFVYFDLEFTVIKGNEIIQVNISKYCDILWNVITLLLTYIYFVRLQNLIFFVLVD